MDGLASDGGCTLIRCRMQYFARLIVALLIAGGATLQSRDAFFSARVQYRERPILLLAQTPRHSPGSHAGPESAEVRRKSTFDTRNAADAAIPVTFHADSCHESRFFQGKLEIGFVHRLWWPPYIRLTRSGWADFPLLQRFLITLSSASLPGPCSSRNKDVHSMISAMAWRG